MESRLDNLEKENKILKEDIENLKKELNGKKPSKKAKVTREPTEYNKFMSSKIAELKKEDSSLDHKKAFSLAVEEWKKQKI